MKVKIHIIEPDQPELAALYCRQIDENIREIERFIQSGHGYITGYSKKQACTIPISEIFYAETVDSHTFVYCRDSVYQSKEKLQQLEETLSSRHFLRISRTVILNLMKVESIRPALNGRFAAILKNGEQVIISRRYVPAFKEKLQKGRSL